MVSSLKLCTVLIFALCIINATVTAAAAASGCDDEHKKLEVVAKKNEWRSVVSTEYGKISDVEIGDGVNGTYYLQLIEMDPNALFLPVILHADMIFYVHSGSGRVTWFDVDGETNGNKHKDKDKSEGISIQRGDVYRLKLGTIFYVHSSLNDERRKLRIYAIFANSVGDLHEPVVGPYSGIRDLVLGFDKRVLQAAFQMPEEAVEQITSAKKPPQIVHAVQNSSSRTFWEVEAQFIEVFLGRNMYSLFEVNKKKKLSDVYNFFTGDRDVENCNGWSTAVSSKQSQSLRGSNIGLFMVNLTKGAMMGPHWNPTATEIAIVLEGQGMVNIVCLGTGRKECNNTRFMVKEGYAFVVPRFHPMAQMAFNNGTFVFVGFTTRDRNNHPQFLTGKRSVLQTLQKHVLAVAFNVSNSTASRLVEPQNDSIILECVSCAEEEEKIMEKEIEKAREEERKKQEEAKRREEEKRRREEEEKKREEEEEARKREEEKRRQEEEERKREEEKRKREEEEKRKREEEEIERRRQEEAARKAGEARKRQEEEKRQREEEAKKREEEEEMKRKKEEEEREREEEARKREEEEERERKREEAAAKRAEEAKGREEEEARRKEKEQAQEEARKREKEKAKKEEETKQEEEQVQQEETRRQQEAAKEAESARKAKEEEQGRRQKEQEEARKRETEKAREEEDRRQGEEQAQREEQKRQQEAARRAKEEEAKQREEEAGSKSKEEEEEQKQEEIEYRPGGGGEGRVFTKKLDW
ncbi:hypothetical protein AgCh_031768 [Apium graveolens]